MQRLTLIGLCLLVGSFLLGALSFALGAVDESFYLLNTFGGPIFLAGIVCIIIGASRGRDRQQQQQIVVYTHPHAQGQPALGPTCSACGRANPPGAAFCGGCGVALAQPRPVRRPGR